MKNVLVGIRIVRGSESLVCLQSGQGGLGPAATSPIWGHCWSKEFENVATIRSRNEKWATEQGYSYFPKLLGFYISLYTPLIEESLPILLFILSIVSHLRVQCIGSQEWGMGSSMSTQASGEALESHQDAENVIKIVVKAGWIVYVGCNKRLCGQLFAEFLQYLLSWEIHVNLHV